MKLHSRLERYFSSWCNKPAVQAGSQYRIYVKAADSTSSVQVLTREGGVDTSDSARKILGLLHQELK